MAGKKNKEGFKNNLNVKVGGVTPNWARPLAANTLSFPTAPAWDSGPLLFPLRIPRNVLNDFHERAHSFITWQP